MQRILLVFVGRTEFYTPHLPHAVLVEDTADAGAEIDDVLIAVFVPGAVDVDVEGEKVFVAGVVVAVGEAFVGLVAGAGGDARCVDLCSSVSVRFQG